MMKCKICGKEFGESKGAKGMHNWHMKTKHWKIWYEEKIMHDIAVKSGRRG